MTILSTLNSVGTPPPAKKPPFVSPPPHSDQRQGINATVNGQETKENAHTISLSLPFTDDDAVNLAPILTSFMTHLKTCDPDARILSNTPNATDITNANEVPKNSKINHFIDNLQSDAVRKRFKFYFTVVSNLTFSEIKYGVDMFSWLKEHRYYILRHGMTTKNVSSVGFILGMHATYANRDEMRALISPYLTDIEFSLVPVNQFFIKNDVRTNVKVVEIHVDSKKIDDARDKIATAFMDPTFLEAVIQGDSNALFDFIPNIKRGVMSLGTFRMALEKHYTFVKNAIGVSIRGVQSLEATVIKHGEEITFAQLLADVTDTAGAPFFTSVEPTKLTEDEGRFILVTTKPKLNDAEKAFDRFVHSLATNGIHDHFAMPGCSIERINRFKSTKMEKYAEGLAAKYQPPASITIPRPDPPSPRRNAWKRQPHIKFDSANFPELQSKKARHADDTSLATTKTALSDERTEFESQLQSMRTSFRDQLTIIKEQGAKQETESKARIATAEQAYSSAQSAMLQEYKAIQESIAASRKDYNEILNRQNQMSLHFQRRDNENRNHSSAVAHVLLSLYTSMSSGTPLAPLTQDIIDRLTPAEDTEMEEHGTGAPGTDAKRSSTDHKGGGRSH